MNTTTVICTDNDKKSAADILEKKDRKLVVVLSNTTIKITLHKDTPHDAVYIGRLHGMEFTSTGE
jgi:hypothetical protein